MKAWRTAVRPGLMSELGQNGLAARELRCPLFPNQGDIGAAACDVRKVPTRHEDNVAPQNPEGIPADASTVGRANHAFT